MRRSNRMITVVALLVATTCAQAAPCDSLHPARWLLGQWAAESSDRIVLETWREASAATFEGSGVTTARSGGAVLDSEELRLVAMGGAVFYVAKVAHNPYPVAFRLVTCEDGRLVFENTTHDFPRRLEYLKQADGGLEVAVSDGAERGFKLQFQRRDRP
jgi:hypothetical protein